MKPPRFDGLLDISAATSHCARVLPAISWSVNEVYGLLTVAVLETWALAVPVLGLKLGRRVPLTRAAGLGLVALSMHAALCGYGYSFYGDLADFVLFGTDYAAYCYLARVLIRAPRWWAKALGWVAIAPVVKLGVLAVAFFFFAPFILGGSLPVRVTPFERDGKHYETRDYCAVEFVTSSPKPCLAKTYRIFRWLGVEHHVGTREVWRDWRD